LPDQTRNLGTFGSAYESNEVKTIKNMTIQTNDNLGVGKQALIVKISMVFGVSRRRPYVLFSIVVIRNSLVDFVGDFYLKCT